MIHHKCFNPLLLFEHPHFYYLVSLIEYINDTAVKSLNGNGMAAAAILDGLEKLLTQPNNNC